MKTTDVATSGNEIFYRFNKIKQNKKKTFSSKKHLNKNQFPFTCCSTKKEYNKIETIFLFFVKWVHWLRLNTINTQVRLIKLFGFQWHGKWYLYETLTLIDRVWFEVFEKKKNNEPFCVKSIAFYNCCHITDSF